MSNALKGPPASADLALPPGPKGMACLGNALQVKRDPLGFLTECARTYGDVVRISLANQLGLLINHPDHIEAAID